MKKSSLSSGVFERTGNNSSVSLQSFYGMIAGFLIYGLAGTAVAAHLVNQANYTPNLLMILLLGLGLPIVGIVIAMKSDNPVYSFIGYNLILVPLGVVLGPVLREYDPNVVRNAAGLTALITFVMGLAGTMFPQVFSKIGSALFFSLSALVLVRIAGIFVPQLNALTIIDYIAAGIFSLYIGYDMWRASEIERTIDNAIDIAVALYLDVINLFLEILKITGSSSDD